MADLSITVSVQGKKPEKLSLPPDTTCGALRRRLETAHGCVDGGLRLIHKGRTPADGATLRAAGVTSGAKLLLLRTAAQMKADKDAAQRAKLQSPSGGGSATANLAELRESAAAKPVPAPMPAPASSAAAAAEEAAVRGDDPEPGVKHVVLQHGRTKLRVNWRDDATVAQLRARAATLLHVRADAVRLVCRGRELRDDAAPARAQGVCDGAAVLALLTAAQHERARRGAARHAVASDTAALEARVAGVAKRVAHRLLDRDGALLVRGELRGEAARLLGNLEASDGGADETQALRERLEAVQRRIEELL